MLRKITAHLAIIFGGMCFVLFVVDQIKGGAMSFINNDITKAFIAILSLLAIFNAVIMLAAQTHEQQLAARLQQYRRQGAAAQRAPQTRTAQTAARPAQQAVRPAQQAVRPAAASARVTSPRPASRSRNPYSSNR